MLQMDTVIWAISEDVKSWSIYAVRTRQKQRTRFSGMNSPNADDIGVRIDEATVNMFMGKSRNGIRDRGKAHGRVRDNVEQYGEMNAANAGLGEQVTRFCTIVCLVTER